MSMQNKWNESSSKQALGHGKKRFKAKPTEIYIYIAMALAIGIRWQSGVFLNSLNAIDDFDVY